VLVPGGGKGGGRGKKKKKKKGEFIKPFQIGHGGNCRHKGKKKRGGETTIDGVVPEERREPAVECWCCNASIEICPQTRNPQGRREGRMGGDLEALPIPRFLIPFY